MPPPPEPTIVSAAGTHAPRRLPSGAQWIIGHGPQRAVVTEVGATLREYRVDGVAVIDGFGENEVAPSGRGQVLAPWPNRLGDGRYEFGGVRAQAPINELATMSAIHGLVRWYPFTIEARAQNVVTVACALPPTPAYPFTLSLTLQYRLGRDGLSVTTTARNDGDGPLPFGLGFHPYLTVGTPRVDTATLRLPASHAMVLDARALPTGEVRPVAGTELDFTRPRPIGAAQLDTAYLGLVFDDGVATAALEDPATGRRVELWVDDAFTHLMCFTADTIGDVTRRRTAVALEPMTCGPDAFRTGRSVVTLEPGHTWTGSWGVRVP